MNLNKVVAVGDQRSEFADIKLKNSSKYDEPMLIERKSLPPTTLKNAIKDKTLTHSNLKRGSKK